MKRVQISEECNGAIFCLWISLDPEVNGHPLQQQRSASTVEGRSILGDLASLNLNSGYSTATVEEEGDDDDVHDGSGPGGGGGIDMSLGKVPNLIISTSVHDANKISDFPD